MLGRAILVHGWGGSPKNDWFPWAKMVLERSGYEVIIPEMPDSEHPKIGSWVAKLSEVVGEVRESDTFIGHSIGCQTIERYLQGLDGFTRLQKVILIAPWVVLTKRTFEEMGEDESIVKPWYNEPIDYEKICGMAKWIAVFSDDDPFVDYSENYPTYRDKLGAEIILKNGQGHFSSEQGVNEIPFLVEMV